MLYAGMCVRNFCMYQSLYRKWNGKKRDKTNTTDHYFQGSVTPIHIFPLAQCKNWTYIHGFNAQHGSGTIKKPMNTTIPKDLLITRFHIFPVAQQNHFANLPFCQDLDCLGLFFLMGTH